MALPHEKTKGSAGMKVLQMLEKPLEWMLKTMIRGYQKFLNPILHAIGGPNTGCRFEPTCSRYCYEAIETHGAIKGLYFGIKRICRCNPWGGCGHDPVPPKKGRSLSK